MYLKMQNRTHIEAHLKILLLYTYCWMLCYHGSFVPFQTKNNYELFAFARLLRLPVQPAVRLRRCRTWLCDGRWHNVDPNFPSEAVKPMTFRRWPKMKAVITTGSAYKEPKNKTVSLTVTRIRCRLRKEKHRLRKWHRLDGQYMEGKGVSKAEATKKWRRRKQMPLQWRVVHGNSRWRQYPASYRRARGQCTGHVENICDPPSQNETLLENNRSLFYCIFG